MRSPLLLVVLWVYIAAPVRSVELERAWDDTIPPSATAEEIFLARMRAVGGPLCDFILGLRLREPSHVCEPRRDCGAYDEWLQATNKKPGGVNKKVVVSIGHNGFGNQLFQHTFSQNVAQHVGASLYVTSMDVTSIGKRIPQNTIQGARWVGSIVDPALKWDALPASHEARRVCADRNATFLARGVDFRSRFRNATAVRSDLLAFLEPHGHIDCLVVLGYFQNKANPCLGNVRRVFSGLDALLTRKSALPFSPQDIVLHLRCPKNAFPGYGVSYIATVLNHTSWDRIYIVKPPGPCQGKSYQPVFKYIMDRYGPLVSVSPGNATGFDDFLTLAMANKFVEDRYSTYSFWAGYFSVGTEVHIDVTNQATGGYILSDSKYVYHNAALHKYFGSFQEKGALLSSGHRSEDGVGGGRVVFTHVPRNHPPKKIK